MGAAAAALCGFLFLFVLETALRTDAIDGVYFHEWPSEFFMQTVSIEDLRAAPLQSLLNIHIQPPGLDAIRALLAGMWKDEDAGTLLRRVDQGLYVVWAILYGLLGALAFAWLARTASVAFAVIGTILLLVHPASIFYATFLDGSFLTAVLVFWAYYLLWLIRHDPRRTLLPLAAAVLLLFFSRTIFQWPAILIFACSLMLFKVPTRRVLTFLVVCGIVVGAYMFKQYRQFGITLTTSFTGYNLVKSIGGDEDDYWNYLARPAASPPDAGLPSVLRREMKFIGVPNFNNLRYLEENRFLVRSYAQQLSGMSWRQLAANYLENLWAYFLPSSQYHDIHKSAIHRHRIVDRLPWRGAYDVVFSFPVLPALLLLAGAGWVRRMKREDCAPELGLLLPATFMLLVSVFFEKGEEMRYKFFLEPVMFVFIATQCHAVGTRFIGRPAS